MSIVSIGRFLLFTARHGLDFSFPARIACFLPFPTRQDKTLDIARGSAVVNVSLGATRTMTLRRKKDAPADARRDATQERVVKVKEFTSCMPRFSV